MVWQVPAGVLYVKLIEAEHVPNMDIFSKTDPFVKLYVRKRNQRRSKTIYNKLHPKCAVAIPLCYPPYCSINRATVDLPQPKCFSGDTLRWGDLQVCVLKQNFKKSCLPAHVQVALTTSAQ